MSHLTLMRTGLVLLALSLLPACSASPWAAPPENIVQAGDSVSLSPPELRVSPYPRPVVAILADNLGAKTTDLLAPHAILTRADVAEVIIVAASVEAVELMPTLQIKANMTFATFMQAYPEGADVVVVPALHSRGAGATTAFLREQGAMGALVLSICEGAEVVAQSGLLEGRSAVTHWFATERLARRYPGVQWVLDTRYLVDGPLMSSSGVSASIPVTLALIELIAGPERARTTGRTLGLDEWGPSHDSGAFAINPRLAATAVANLVGFWRHEELAVLVDDGFDGANFALQADAWSRTYRSSVVAINPKGEAVSAEGVVFLTERSTGGRPELAAAEGPAALVLDDTLAAIAQRYGAGVAALVAVQLEYPWPQADGAPEAPRRLSHLGLSRRRPVR